MQLIISLPERTDQLASNRERWAEVLADPQWHSTPNRIETNAFGQIVMTPPPGIPHGSRQSEIVYQLRRLLDGRVVTECPVSTADGVKGIDVAWFSNARYQSVQGQTLGEIAPEVCIEVLSPSNTDAELATKRALYFDAGAIECWQCDRSGHMTYYHSSAPNKSTSQSKLCPSFPSVIED